MDQINANNSLILKNRLKKMATCHRVESLDARISCPCCSDEEAVCTWTGSITITCIITSQPFNACTDEDILHLKKKL